MSAIVAELLGEARQRAGVSQRELARRSGIPQPVISAYERGRREPAAATLERLLEAAGQRLAIVPLPRLDPEQAGRLLADLLDLADHLPRGADVRARRTKLRYPRLGD